MSIIYWRVPIPFGGKYAPMFWSSSPLCLREALHLNLRGDDRTHDSSVDCRTYINRAGNKCSIKLVDGALFLYLRLDNLFVECALHKFVFEHDSAV